MSKALRNLSVILPTLNEEERIRRLLQELKSQKGLLLEIIVADGGSWDQTAYMAREQGVMVVRTDAGRGRQMNAGARAATMEILLFLHADSSFEGPYFLQSALKEYEQRRQRQRGILGGHFRLQFHCESGTCSPVYSFLEAKSGINRRDTFNGDQGLLISRQDFFEVGGFQEDLPFLEDKYMGRLILARGEMFTLQGKLITSARRFEREGFWQRYVLMAIIMGAFAASADDLLKNLPEFYIPQNQADELDLTPYLDGIFQYLDELEVQRYEEITAEVGSFVRENAWQLFLIPDLLGIWPCKWLELYDALVAPVLEKPFFDELAKRLTLQALNGLYQGLKWREKKAY